MVNITPLPLYPGERTAVSMVLAAVWDLEPIWTVWRKLSCPHREMNPQPPGL